MWAFQTIKKKSIDGGWTPRFRAFFFFLSYHIINWHKILQGKIFFLTKQLVLLCFNTSKKIRAGSFVKKSVMQMLKVRFEFCKNFQPRYVSMLHFLTLFLRCHDQIRHAALNGPVSMRVYLSNSSTGQFY